jgi:hypothetical protein
MKKSWDQGQGIAVSFKTKFYRISNTIMSALDGIITVLIVVRFRVLKEASMKFTVLRLFPHLTTRHRHVPTTTRQGNIVTVTLNWPVHIQRHRYDSDNRQTLKESRAAWTCLSGSVNRRSDTAQSVSCCVFLVERGSRFFLVESPSYFFNNEYWAAHWACECNPILYWACECNPLLYDLNHKYSDVQLQQKNFLRGCGKIGGKLNQTGLYTFLYFYKHLLINTNNDIA